MGPQILVPILISMSICALIFGIVYTRNKENMALIERGINPRTGSPRPGFLGSLKWGLLMMGSGLGMFIAYFIDRTTSHWIIAADGTRHQSDNTALYFGLIAIGGGLGLVISYMLEKKHWTNTNKH